ncbi:MAG: KH domain-containing protein [Clostridium sp.]|nr:MAG: KH domain-containing protein [Clostridium sp.]
MMIKAIKEQALKEIRNLMGQKVHLDLWIKVKENWRDSAKDLNNLGYSEKFIKMDEMQGIIFLIQLIRRKVTKL